MYSAQLSHPTKSRESRKKHHDFSLTYFSLSLIHVQQGATTLNINNQETQRSRENHQQQESRNPPKDPERNINKPRPRHLEPSLSRLNHHCLLEPSLSPPRFDLFGFFFFLRSLGLFFCLRSLGLFFMGSLGFHLSSLKNAEIKSLTLKIKSSLTNSICIVQNRVYCTQDISFLNSFENVLTNEIVWKFVLFWRRKKIPCFANK